MYFIHYFYVSVTDDAPKCPGAESPASSWPCAELSRRRVGRAESVAPSCPIPHPGSPRKKAIKRVCVCLCVCNRNT